METFLKAVGFIAVILVMVVLMVYPTIWMMNYLFSPSALHAVFGVTAIDFWRAFIINLIWTSLAIKK